MPDSLNDWKRVPTTTSTLFGVDLPYRPPESAFGTFLWRKRMWIETTFALSVLEPWEKVFVLCLAFFLLTLVFTGLLKLTPQQLPFIYSRLVYYIHGNETVLEGTCLHLDTTSSATASSWLLRNASSSGL